MLRNSDIIAIPNKLRELVSGDHNTFLSSFLNIYGFPRTTISRAVATLENSTDRRSAVRQKILYKECQPSDNLEEIYFDVLKEAKTERIVFATDFDRILAKDMMSDQSLDISFADLPDNYEFFLPWCGREIIKQETEHPADVKAATEMARLFEIIVKANKDNDQLDERAHNIFLTRLLFCFYADDTKIFGKDQFHNSILRNTAPDGSDMQTFLKGLFEVLDTEPGYRDPNLHPAYKGFPYVNGGLFRKRLPIPVFDKAARKKLLECSAVNWSEINPDIFGSMFQTVINKEQRHSLGQHYTSVSNIMKVLRPLFLDDLHAELDKILETPKNTARDRNLTQFRNRLANIAVFDPACGSGNFLIIAYKELCHLEMEAIENYSVSELPLLEIRLSNFYGIEIDDFPCEVARLALWIMQHQINMECYAKFGNANPTLPLTQSGNIVCGNSLRLNWDTVCSGFGNREVYVCGNPPYNGFKGASNQQKEDIAFVCGGRPICGKMDVISCWFLLAARYMEGRTSIKASFVTTNSICQGVQVALWPEIFKKGIEISFAYTPFKWTNNATDKAGVTVTIIGLSNPGQYQKKIYNGKNVFLVNNISPYLSDTINNIVVKPKSTVFFGLPEMDIGDSFYDGSGLMLTTPEKESFIAKYPDLEYVIKKAVGGKDYINGEERWCLWISDKDIPTIKENPFIQERLEKVKKFRLSSTCKSTRDHATTPWKPKAIRHMDNATCLMIPYTSSEKREYIPIGYIEKETVVMAPHQVIYDAPLWLFAILTSRMHMTWMRAVAGRMKTDYRYSNTLVYNTFPFPTLTDAQKKALESTATSILDAREKHYEMTMGQLYNPDTMPKDLLAAHKMNDLLVDSIFKKTGFKNDEERLDELYKRYQENLVAEENRRKEKRSKTKTKKNKENSDA